jgi:cob(I)alamin adenosyltransferase
MKIYTKTGDDGSTGLYGGERVAKNDPRVRAYGAVDEANAALGLARSGLAAGEGAVAAVAELVDRIQNTLFDLGADLATPLDARTRDRIDPIVAADVALLEAAIDRFDADLPPLTTFVLPGGHPAAAALHLARTVVRRAEREAVALAGGVANPTVAIYLNRLSDLLFVLARAVNAATGVADTPWVKRTPTNTD